MCTMPLLPRHGMSPEHRESEREKEKVKEEQKETCIFMCTSVHTHIHFWSIFWSFWGTKISCHQPRSTKKDFSFFFLFSAGCVTKVPIFKSLWTRDLLWNLKNSIRKHNDNHHCLRCGKWPRKCKSIICRLLVFILWAAASRQTRAHIQ